MTALSPWNPGLLGFECPECDAMVEPGSLEPVCPRCGRPLVARYDLPRVRDAAARARAGGASPDLWRWQAVLPLSEAGSPVRLGEGGTPLRPLHRLGQTLGARAPWLKEEAPNPTHSFKARGLALAVNGALALGRRAIALPSAGNAGSAAAAYAAAAGLACRITVPEDTPAIFVIEIAVYAHLMNRKDIEFGIREEG